MVFLPGITKPGSSNRIKLRNPSHSTIRIGLMSTIIMLTIFCTMSLARASQHCCGLKKTSSDFCEYELPLSSSERFLLYNTEWHFSRWSLKLVVPPQYAYNLLQIVQRAFLSSFFFVKYFHTSEVPLLCAVAVDVG